MEKHQDTTMDTRLPRTRIQQIQCKHRPIIPNRSHHILPTLRNHHTTITLFQSQRIKKVTPLKLRRPTRPRVTTGSHTRMQSTRKVTHPIHEQQRNIKNRCAEPYHTRLPGSHQWVSWSSAKCQECHQGNARQGHHTHLPPPTAEDRSTLFHILQSRSGKINKLIPIDTNRNTNSWPTIV